MQRGGILLSCLEQALVRLVLIRALHQACHVAQGHTPVVQRCVGSVLQAPGCLVAPTGLQAGAHGTAWATIWWTGGAAPRQVMHSAPDKILWSTTCCGRQACKRLRFSEVQVVQRACALIVLGQPAAAVKWYHCSEWHGLDSLT